MFVSNPLAFTAIYNNLSAIYYPQADDLVDWLEKEGM